MVRGQGHKYVLYCWCTQSKAHPGYWGNRRTRAFISGEQGNKGLKLKGTGKQRQFWGTWNIGNRDLAFGEQGSRAIYFRETRAEVPPGRASDLKYVVYQNED